MATRSLIIIDLDNTVTSQYCHWNGGLNNNGKMLSRHYTSKNKIKKLRALGDISFLEKNCTKPKGHTFDTPIEGYTVAYRRDRNETGVDSIEHKSIEDAINSAGEMIAFIYVYADNKWNVHLNGYLIPLSNKVDYTYI